MPKEFRFRGKTLDELRGLSVDDFFKLLDSGSRRKLRRGFTEQEKRLLEKVRKEPERFHKTHARGMVILPEMVGVKFGVFNGKEWTQVTVSQEMVGYRLGDFSIPVKRVQHSSPGVGASRGSKHVSVK